MKRADFISGKTRTKPTQKQMKKAYQEVHLETYPNDDEMKTFDMVFDARMESERRRIAEMNVAYGPTLSQLFTKSDDMMTVDDVRRIRQALVNNESRQSMEQDRSPRGSIRHTCGHINPSSHRFCEGCWEKIEK